MIAIIDYQMGNLRSVQKAFEKVGFAAHITCDPHEIASADRVILPGVGAFRDAIAEIRKRDLVSPIKDAIDSGKPFLGICLGLQLLMQVSHEEGTYEGLGIFPGEVIKFDIPVEYKVPHMGWNQVQIKFDHPVLNGIQPDSHFYFVHSYFVAPQQNDLVVLESNYPQPFCAAIAKENVFATQFHPEKSQTDGLKLLKNFAELDSSVMA